MKFRPCIDIHNGKVKQLIGGTLKDEGNCAVENFVAEKDAVCFAEMYAKDGLNGGHIIILNHKDSEYYEDSKKQAMAALKAFPGRMQIGGGINAENAGMFIDAGASHVIVTSCIFKNGTVDFPYLDRLAQTVGKDKIVVDLSCRKKGKTFYVVTDRWQKFTDVEMNQETLDRLSAYCDEFLIHGVDVEGKGSGMDGELVTILSSWKKKNKDLCAVTYAGGLSSCSEIERFEKICDGYLDFTVGSALDIFGGSLPYHEIAKKYK